MTSHRPIRWGILGTSPISHTVAEAIKASKEGELVAIGGRTLEKAKQFAQQHQLPKYDYYEALLSDKEIDAIYIGLPNHMHADWIALCAKAGKHILCEKPLVTTVREAHEAFAEVKTADVVCMEALMYRYHPLTYRLGELIKQKVIGDVKLINAVYMVDILNVMNPVAGGSILNIGCYPISLVRWLAGHALGKQVAEPNEVVSLGDLNGEVMDRQASILLKFDQQIQAMVHASCDTGKYASCQIYGTEGQMNIVTNPWMPLQTGNKITITRHDSDNIQEISVDAEKPLYTYQIDVMNDAILKDDQGSDAGISWHESIGNMAVLEAWLQQIKTEQYDISKYINQALV